MTHPREPASRRLPDPEGLVAEQIDFYRYEAAAYAAWLEELHGRRFHVVKAVWESAALEARLAGLGWSARVERSERSIWGTVVARSA